MPVQRGDALPTHPRIPNPQGGGSLCRAAPLRRTAGAIRWGRIPASRRAASWAWSSRGLSRKTPGSLDQKSHNVQSGSAAGEMC